MKIKRIVFLLVFVLMFSSSLMAAPLNSAYKLGQFETGTLKLLFKNASIDTYKAYNTHYIAVSDLKQFGLNIGYNHDTKMVSISLPAGSPVVTTSAALSIKDTSFSNYTGTVQVGNFESQALVCDGRTFIPLAALGQVGTLSFSEDICQFAPTYQLPVLATETSLKSFYSEPLELTVLDIYWKNETILHTSTYTLNPDEVLTRTPSVTDENALYVASIVQSAVGGELNYINRSYLGQVNDALLEKYFRIQNGTFLNDYGDPITLDKIIWAEDTVNNKGLKSPTKYLVWTDISEQRTYIFEGSQGNWSLLKHFICSTGKDRTPTPTGEFALTYKVPSFGQNKGYCCKYAYGFIGTTYLYHSIIYDKTGTYLLENKGVLGKKASDGCIRFSTEHALWFYDTLIPGTTVYIS